MGALLTTVSRRLRRMRRRRKVGRAYDMALEIARILKRNDRVLDVGCGNGFIAHHLTALLNSRVIGLDVARNTSAHIDYIPYDGRHFPVRERSFDAVLLCYVLHHADDARLVLDEVRRVLKDGALVIVYEDNPFNWWDRAICWSHNLQWQGRTGRCTFKLESDWKRTFALAGFNVVSQRGMSRWRNIAHPVARNFFVLKTENEMATNPPTPRYEPTVVAVQQEIRAGV